MPHAAARRLPNAAEVAPSESPAPPTHHVLPILERWHAHVADVAGLV